MQFRLQREPLPRERRVALIPRDVARLTDKGHTVSIEPGAGTRAGFTDEMYGESGGVIAEEDSPGSVLVGVEPLSRPVPPGSIGVVGFLDPLGEPRRISEVAGSGVSAFSLEMVPRTTLAQSMDALSSQATVAGYEAVLLAASELPRFFPMMMTAAGTIRPATVLVLGAGVAGLQAIATARRLGAVVSAYDIRPAAREQVESLGAKFVGGPVVDESEMSGGYAKEVDESTRAAQLDALRDAVAKSDVIITTAQVPGRRAPVLLTAEMVDSMRPGAVIVDIAAATGGNCELTVADTVVDRGGVAIHGPTDLASRGAGHASEMLSRNVVGLIEHLVGVGAFEGASNDEIASSTCVARDGAIVNERVREAGGIG